MTKIKMTSMYAVLIATLLYSCNNVTKEESTTESEIAGGSGIVHINSADVLENQLLTKQQQDELKPQQVLDLLMEGNNDYIADNLTVRNNSARVREASVGQYPKAMVLSCVDSRVPVEDVFHRGIGDIFVGRVAGNIVNEDLVGSMEFATKVSGAKVILVLGHEHCGAIKSAIDDVKLGNITTLLSKIRPAVKATEFHGEKSSGNDDYVKAVTLQNIKMTMNNIRNSSPILAEMEKNEELIIRGGIYNMESGKVSLL